MQILRAKGDVSGNGCNGIFLLGITHYSRGAKQDGKALGDQKPEKTCNHVRPRCKPPAHRYEIIIADPRLALIN